ncbi:hypothetical protein Tco_0924109 [Tanacetum coccineum]|uniref:Uncharacterized protein n=1 Tax=Tanacetum coccineum TaxID=301880 RepID=A0ABQ5D304_9ASTR
MLQICPKLPGQKFEDPPFEEEILSFNRDLRHTGEIKVLSDGNVNHMHQPWRSFATIINKCLSGKTTALESLRLSRAQILWGMYHNKNVDYVYLLWEDLVYQVENNNSKKNNDMDDPMFTTIRVISKYHDTQIYGVILPQHLTNQAMLESKAYKTYDAYATGEKIPKPKYVKNKANPESFPKKKSAQASKGKILKTLTKVAKPVKKKQPATTSKAKGVHEGTGVSPESEHDDDQDDDNADNEGDDDQDDDNEHTELDNDDDDFVYPKLSTFDEKERQDEEDKEEEWSDDEAYDEVTQVIEDTHVIITDVTTEVQQQSSSVSSSPTCSTLIQIQSVTTLPLPPIPFSSTSFNKHQFPHHRLFPSTSLQNLPTFDSLFKFEDRVKALEDNFLEFKQTNLFAEVVSSIPSIVDTYLANKMNEAIKAAIQLQSDRLRKEAQADNEDFINKIDENMKKIIKEQVKVQVKEQVSKILPKIEKSVNEQLEAEVLIRSSNEAKTSHIVAANLSELELKKILIDKMEKNKSIDISVQQNTLYKALVDAYESDKDILASYGDTRRRARKEPESTSAPKEKTSKSTGKSKEGSKSHEKSTGKSAQAEEPIHADEDFLVELEYFLEEVCKATTDQLDWNNPEGQQYPHDLLKKTNAADYGHVKWIEDFVPNSMWSQVPSVYEKHALWGISYWGRKRQQFYGFAVNRESARDVYSKHIILAVTKLKIVEWHNYKHLDWITVRRNDDKLYTFKEGDYNRLHLQDIEDMLLLLVQGKLTNLNIEERLALGVSLRIFTRSVGPQRRLEDLSRERAGAMIQAIDRQLRNKKVIEEPWKISIGGDFYGETFGHCWKDI